MSQPRTMPQPGGMPKPPGQPMPGPNNASPMAGLGSVEDRVSAYRGNPAPLQQRYAMSQDLLDLLALQKIKSEKDAAARQMQLQMSQHQAMQGDGPMTVAQQREKEVHDLTKNELAQERGATAQHQMDQQKEAMQRMASGVAAAPGAASAAQPAMMATGGIVAFAAGGDMPGAAEENPEFDADGNPRPRSERERIEARNARLREMRSNAQGLGAMRDARMAGLGATASGVPERMAEFYKPRRPDVSSAAQAVTTQGEVAPSPQATTPQATTPTAVPTPPAAPRPAASAAGLGTLPAAAPSGPGTAADPLAAALREKAMSTMNIDPQAQRLEEEKRQAGLMEFPEEQQRRQGYAGKLQKLYEQDFDPERQREDALIAFLTGAGGRRYGVLGAGAQAATAYEQGQRKQQMERLKGIEDVNQGIFGLHKGAIEKGITGGEKAFEQGSALQRQGLETGRGIYNTETQARDSALNREIEKLKIGVQSETNRISREGLDLSKAQTVYATATGRMQELERKLDADFAKQNGMLLMAEQSGKMDPAQKQQLDVARTQLEMQKNQIRKELEPVLASARAKLGLGSSAMSSEDKALVDKYAKGK